MMKDKEKTEKFEAFKAGILKWKNEHREEYNEFARIMTNCDETFYYQIFKAVSGQMRHIAREWELSWGDDGDETFDSIFILVSKENLPQKISEMFSVAVSDSEEKAGLMNKVRRALGLKTKARVRLSAPLVLSWLFYGKSFESMVAMIEKQRSNAHIERADRRKCSAATKAVIAVSIRNGYRTKNDWERYFAMEKADKNKETGEWALQDVMQDMTAEIEEAPETESVQHTMPGRKKSKESPLIDYLPTDSGETIVSYIRSFVISHQSAMQQALPYFVLREMPLRLPLLNGVEYAIAMTKQFPDVSELRSDHSLRQAVGKLAGTDTQMLMKDGKMQVCRYIESDENRELLRRLRDDLREWFHKT